ncbi:MAG: hypothetical protein QGI21_00840 [Candidatus Poseidoniaceae archaeon]|jgi:hypothetical protein|nr:hypothetical protein [Candidatus Poseidoniaceae archaeon]
MWDVFARFALGAIIGHFMIRIPTLFFPRMYTWNDQFPPHPDPIPLNPYLTQRVLHMRKFYWMSIVFAIVPLFFGYNSVKYGASDLGFGLWIAAGWTVLSRITALVSGEDAPWTMNMAMEIQNVINKCDSSESCCNHPRPMWEVTSVRCLTCFAVLLNTPRPDLGRPRKDGRIKGLIRLLITDGKPLVAGNIELKEEE